MLFRSAEDLRDLSFLEDNQEKLQGKYNRPVELFTTPGGDLAVTLDLFRLPMVFTINNDTGNLGLLKTSDFLKKRGDVRVLSFSGRLQDYKQKKACLTKPQYIARVKQVLQTTKAKRVASNIACGCWKTRKEVADEKGAAARS